MFDVPESLRTFWSCKAVLIFETNMMTRTNAKWSAYLLKNPYESPLVCDFESFMMTMTKNEGILIVIAIYLDMHEHG